MKAKGPKYPHSPKLILARGYYGYAEEKKHVFFQKKLISIFCCHGNSNKNNAYNLESPGFLGALNIYHDHTF